MKVIIVTGSVGTGKSTLARRLAKKLGFDYIDVNKLIREDRLSSGYDKKRKCKIVDIKKLNNFLAGIIKKSRKNLVIDSHLSHYLPRRYVDLCIVTRCSLKELNKRLKRRKYAGNKIKENVECEIFDICLNEAKERKHKIFVIDTTKGINISEISKKAR